MHPQLSDRKLVCQEFIEALEACHKSGWARLTGACNEQKHTLNHCLRKERVARTTQHREEAKVRNEKVKEVWREFHEDD